MSDKIKTMIQDHVAFAKDQGIDCDSCWINLQDTIAEHGLQSAANPMWSQIESLFNKAWKA